MLPACPSDRLRRADGDASGRPGKAGLTGKIESNQMNGFSMLPACPSDRLRRADGDASGRPGKAGLTGKIESNQMNGFGMLPGYPSDRLRRADGDACQAIHQTATVGEAGVTEKNSSFKKNTTMYFIAGEIYHIYNRGNNKQTIFFNDDNYINFLRKVKRDWKPFCEILCWCLMPNHFHFMIQATDNSCHNVSAYGNKSIQTLARKIGLSLSSYAQYINRQNNTTGSLFQQKTKVKCISDIDNEEKKLRSSASYIIDCMHYIHQNPWKGGLAANIEDWVYSSFPDFIGRRRGTLCNTNLMLELSGYDQETFYKDSYGVIGKYSV